MSNVDTAAHLIKHKAGGTGDGITTAIPGSSELPGWFHVKRKPWEILACQLRRREERERLAGLCLNSTWTPTNFPRGHQQWGGRGLEWVGGWEDVHHSQKDDERVEDERQRRAADTLLTGLHVQ